MYKSKVFFISFMGPQMKMPWAWMGQETQLVWNGTLHISEYYMYRIAPYNSTDPK